MSSRLSCTVVVREIHKMIQGRDISECKTITMIIYIYIYMCVYICVCVYIYIYIRGINRMGYTPCCKTCLSSGGSTFKKIKMYEDLCCIHRPYLSLFVIQSIAGKRPWI